MGGKPAVFIYSEALKNLLTSWGYKQSYVEQILYYRKKQQGSSLVAVSIEEFPVNAGICQDMSIEKTSKFKYDLKNICRSKCYLGWKYTLVTMVIIIILNHPSSVQ